jgi:hypothetical protein
MRRAPLIAALAALVLAGASILLSAVLFTRLDSEGAQRRDQSCRLFEADHLADVQRLKRTYEYLDRLPVREYGSTLTREIVRSLPTLEDEARADSAPDFCDEPGAKAEKAGADPVGLPEPDPFIPKRRDFGHTLRRR